MYPANVYTKETCVNTTKIPTYIQKRPKYIYNRPAYILKGLLLECILNRSVVFIYRSFLCTYRSNISMHIY